MALIANGMAPGPQPQPQAAPQSGNVVQRIVTAATMMLNTDQVEQHILQLIKGGDPVQGLAQALVFIMQALGQAMLPILQQIAKMAQAAKVAQITPPMLQQAGKMALQLLQQSAAPQGVPAASQPAPAPQGA